MLGKVKRFIQRKWSHVYYSLFLGRLGSNSYILKPIQIIGSKSIFMGDDVYIMDGARLEAITSHNGDSFSPLIKIGDKTKIEQGVHITCANSVYIGNDCSILARVTITDISHPYADIYISPSEQKLYVNPVKIGDQCMIGTGTVIFPGVTLGKHCIVGANSVVTNSFPDYCVVAGAPAKMIKKYNEDLDDWVLCEDE